MDKMADFTAHRHPVLAVACPTCRAKAGTWCVRPSEHSACGLHVTRRTLADKVFIEKYGETASIDQRSPWPTAEGVSIVIGVY